MGKADTITKAYMSDSAIFADLFNKVLYHGKQRIKPEQLSPVDVAEIALPYGTNATRTAVQKQRDVAKHLIVNTDGHVAYACILGVENQTNVHYAMPVKSALYDILNLSTQVQIAAQSHRDAHNYGNSAEFLSGFHKDDRLIPVVTTTVHFGPEPWDGPMSLKDMYACEDAIILEHAIDYKINLISPGMMTEKDIDEFHTSLREVLLCIQASQDEERLEKVLLNNPRCRQLEHLAAELIYTVTGSQFIKPPKGKETIDMYNAWDERIKRSRVETILENIRALMESTKWSAQQAMDALKISPEQQKELAPLI